MEKKQQLYSENGEKCMQGSDGKRIYRWIKKPHGHVTIPNEIPTQSRQSQFTLHTLQIHSCYWKRTSLNGLVVGWAMTYKRGMTVPESKPTPTASNQRTGNARRKHLGVHLLEENRSLRLVDECTLEEITSRVNKRMWRRVNQCTWRWNSRWTQKTMMWIPRQVTTSTPGEGAESIPGEKPASNWRW